MTESKSACMFKLIAATIAGIFFFMIPLTINGDIIIPFSLVTKLATGAVSFFPEIVTVTAIISAILGIYFTCIKKDVKSEYLKTLFLVTPVMLVFRIIAAVVSLCVILQAGHEYIYNEYTGGLIVNELMPSLFVMFFLASTFFPLLLDFGAMEIFGMMTKSFMRLLFRLPGMSSLLAVGGWIGGGTVVMLSTDTEYQKGYLTAREAITLVFGFCTISLPATFVYSTAIGGLEVQYFPIFYLTCIICGVVTTAIIARIPPISKKSMEYYKNTEIAEDNSAKKELGIDAALERAKNAPSLVCLLKKGIKKSVILYIDACPVIIFVATVALVASEFTPIFKIMAIPFTPVLEWIGLPEAEQAGPSFILGFIDLLLPFLGAGALTSQLTKFVVCVVGVIQIICISETGAVLLKSKLPINLLDLTIVVIEKTLITIPIALIIGRLTGLG